MWFQNRKAKLKKMTKEVRQFGIEVTTSGGSSAGEINGIFILFKGLF